MNYEEKYKEALKRADSLTEKYGGREFAEYVFPELAESEDERIRKQLIDAIKIGRSNSGISFTEEAASRYIAWLEKQKEQDNEEGDFTIYHPLKNGKGEYKCIPYSFYGSLTSFSEDKDLIDFLRTCFYTEEECNEWIEQQKEPHYTKRNALFDKCVENCDPAIMKKVSDEIDEMLEKEQKPDDPLNDPRFGDGFDAGRAVQRIFDETEETCKESLQVQETCKENQDSFTDEPKEMSVSEAMAHLEEKIAKASKSWEGVDVDKFLDEIRGRAPDDCIRLKRGVCRLDMKPCRENCPLHKTREEMEQQRKSNV